MVAINTEETETQAELQRGIFEKTVNKLEQKEAEEKELKDQTFLIQQQNFIKATRQAMLIASQNSDFDDVQQVMKNMRMADLNVPPKITNEERLKKIVAQQPEYKDEYEGFGSLTEMIKNQEKLAEKQLQQQNQTDTLSRMKAKLAQALS